MNDGRRRWLFRAGLILFGILPSLWTASKLAERALPGYGVNRSQAWSEQLRSATGLAVTFQSCQSQRAGVTLTNVELRDPESNRLIGRVASLNIVRRGEQVEVTGQQLEIQEAELVRIWPRMQIELLHNWRERVSQCQIQIEQCIVVMDDTARTYSQLSANWVATPKQSELSLKARPAEPSANSLDLRWTRLRKQWPPQDQWEFSTGAQFVHCRDLAAYWPTIAQLGEHAQFRGAVRMEQTSQGQNIEVAGVISELELERVVTHHFPHKLSGVAEFALTECRITRGRLEHAQGTLMARDGVVSSSLIQSAALHLGLLLQGTTPLPSLVRYQSLAFRFDVSAEGLRVDGLAQEPSGSGNVVLLADEVRLRHQPMPPIGIQRIVQMLAPANQLQVPASIQTDQLLRWLPVPELQVGAPNGYAPLRLRESD